MLRVFQDSRLDNKYSDACMCVCGGDRERKKRGTQRKKVANEWISFFLLFMNTNEQCRYIVDCTDTADVRMVSKLTIIMSNYTITHIFCFLLLRTPPFDADKYWCIRQTFPNDVILVRAFVMGALQSKKIAFRIQRMENYKIAQNSYIRTWRKSVNYGVIHFSFLFLSFVPQFMLICIVQPCHVINIIWLVCFDVNWHKSNEQNGK